VILAGGSVRSLLLEAKIIPLSKSIKTYAFAFKLGAGGIGAAYARLPKMTIIMREYICLYIVLY
jgi:hypothetical protein